MTQTPISKAIEQLKEKIKNSNYALYTIGCEDAIQILTDLLPYEREVIEQIYEDVDDDRIAYQAGEKVKYHSSTDYFTKTFNN